MDLGISLEKQLPFLDLHVFRMPCKICDAFFFVFFLQSFLYDSVSLASEWNLHADLEVQSKIIDKYSR